MQFAVRFRARYYNNKFLTDLFNVLEQLMDLLVLHPDGVLQLPEALLVHLSPTK